MKELLIIPIIAITLLSIATQLVETAEESGEKVTAYAQDMTNAMDCAFLGKPLEECSPNLLETDFKEDMVKTQEELKAIQEELLLLQQEIEKTQETMS